MPLDACCIPLKLKKKKEKKYKKAIAPHHLDVYLLDNVN